MLRPTRERDQQLEGIVDLTLEKDLLLWSPVGVPLALAFRPILRH